MKKKVKHILEFKSNHGEKCTLIVEGGAPFKELKEAAGKKKVKGADTILEVYSGSPL